MQTKGFTLRYGFRIPLLQTRFNNFTLLVANTRRVFILRIFFKTAYLSNTKIMVLSSLLAAISVLGKFISQYQSEVIRFSFENTPIILCGMLFGPIMGFLVGFISDILGCLLCGYTINPIITLGCALMGFFAGTVYELFKKRKTLSIILGVVIPHIISSLIIKTIGLYFMFPQPILVLITERIFNYMIIATIDCVIITALMKNKSFYRQISKITGAKNEL